MIMYADDTILYCNINETTAEGFINSFIWLKTNKLSLNVAKTKCIVFHISNKKVKYPKLNKAKLQFPWSTCTLQYDMVEIAQKRCL